MPLWNHFAVRTGIGQVVICGVKEIPAHDFVFV
jgi:hypothetical protein